MREKKFLNNKINFCIIEDDKSFSDTFASLLEKYGNVTQIGTYKKAMEYLKVLRPDILFVDMNLNGEMDGLKIVSFAALKDIYCVVVSGCEQNDIIKNCFNRGAKDYYVKGHEIALVNDIIEKYKKIYRHPSKNDFVFTSNPLFKENLEFILNNAKSNFPILLYGPTGSGKTFFAKQIHMRSELEGKFVAVNCSSIPQELFESEMFGHSKGAFTGANQAYDGKILEANNGTLYLDEIDSMPLGQQAKLLKVVEDKEFYPVGSNKIKKSNFRLVCSSQKDLKSLISKGLFREDLYYRLSFIQTKILPLAERSSDIIPLLKNMLKKGPRRHQFTDGAISAIENYSWPGNIRELQIFSSNIELSKESTVSEEYVRSYLNQKVNDPYVLTEYQKEIFNEIGFNKFMELIRAEIIQYCLKKNSGQVDFTINELAISSASYYRWKDVTYHKEDI